MIGIMLDCSRNAVLSVPSLKRYAQIAKKMGYNTILLYMEDTYEVDNQPFFGHLRGRYSKAEMQEMDAYCADIGIELIPCIQTLAHLATLFRWRHQYDDIRDCDDILLIGDEKTYALIEDMVSTLAGCFRSKKIHIGMDEAHNVGLGQYLKKHGMMKNKYDIMNGHLHRVCEILRKYDRVPMIWGDMFRALGFEIDRGERVKPEHVPALQRKEKLPEEVLFVYYNYNALDYDYYAETLRLHRHFERELYFCGCVHTHWGFVPQTGYSIRRTEPAMRAYRDTDVSGMFLTAWGDDGGECSMFAPLPALLYGAETAKGNTDMDDIRAKFKEITGCNFDDFMLFDMDNPGPGHEAGAEGMEGISKYMLYSDPFLGNRDCFCKPEHSAFYAEVCEKLRGVRERGEFGYLFDFYEKLAAVLAIKADLGVRTREAYQNRDMTALRDVIQDYETLEKRLKALYDVHSTRWFTDNKPHGFEVQDIRLGGLMMRVHACKERLVQFTAGAIGEIPELCEPVLADDLITNRWQHYVTQNYAHFGNR